METIIDRITGWGLVSSLLRIVAYMWLASFGWEVVIIAFVMVLVTHYEAKSKYSPQPGTELIKK